MTETTLTPEDERLLIRDLALAVEANCKDGDSFYMITQRWWQNWIDYVNQDNIDTSSVNEHSDSVFCSKRPAQIDNSDLICYSSSEDSSDEIIDTLLEGRDYVLLPQEVWNQLYSWYGGGPTLARKAIYSGASQTELTVEVYPIRLQVLILPKGDRAAIRISKKETVGDLHQRVCNCFNLIYEHISIWDYYGLRKHALMSDMDKTLEDVNIQMDQDILVEVHNNSNGVSDLSKYDQMHDDGLKEDGHFLLEPSISNVSIAGGLSASKDFSRTDSDLATGGDTESKDMGSMSTRAVSVGLTGLQNLGNTCFMNSAIQCLVHTPEFANYFREDYHQEINWQNPLGMVGELALAFGELLRKLWAPGRTPVAPRPFKAKLARFAPQFSGYNQHDSQELLAFLLDGLHEDLNRVKDKPYINSRDADGRSDEEVADEYWANHIARNDSIIVDVCQGQYKSTLVCPVCSKVSVTFDPFMYLSLPLQSTIMRSMIVTVFSCDGTSPPIPCNVNVPKQGRFRDLIHVLSAACPLNKNEELKLAEVRNNSSHSFMEDPLVYLSAIKDDDHLVAYKVPKLESPATTLKLIFRRQEQVKNDAQSASRWKPFGAPLLVPIQYDDVVTPNDIHSAVVLALSPLLKREQSSSEAESPFFLPIQLLENGEYVDISKLDVINQSSSSLEACVDFSSKVADVYDACHVENLPEVFKYGSVNKKARHEPLSLYTCLEAFLREEPLVPEDMWFCPQCKERRQASKKLDLWRLPEVLVIHLKRFSYSRSMKHKLETFVNFPVRDFDLTNYIANKNNTHQQLYELYALINHYGGMGSGHYTAYIKLLDDNKWHNFDDSHISQMSEEEVKSAAAYVLFYRRRKSNDGV